MRQSNQTDENSPFTFSQPSRILFSPFRRSRSMVIRRFLSSSSCTDKPCTLLSPLDFKVGLPSESAAQKSISSKDVHWHRRSVPIPTKLRYSMESSRLSPASHLLAARQSSVPLAFRSELASQTFCSRPTPRSCVVLFIFHSQAGSRSCASQSLKPRLGAVW